jgi:hypothetical protein
LLLLPLVQGAWQTPTTTAQNAMAEVFSDDLNLKIGDLFSRHLSHATSPPLRAAHALASVARAHPCRHHTPHVYMPLNALEFVACLKFVVPKI